MQTLIGNAAGEGSTNKVQKVPAVGLALNFIESGINTLVYLILPETIAKFFTQDPETVEILKNIIIIYGLTHLFDASSNHLGGILRTIGSERIVLINFLLSYVLIGLPAE